MMFGKSKKITALERALERQRGVSDRWREAWSKRGDELNRARLKLDFIKCLKVHTDADGKRFVYLPEGWKP